MSAPTHYDREEMTRPGHTPLLVQNRWGEPTGSCSCGWFYDGLTMAGTVNAIHRHIGTVDVVCPSNPAVQR